MPRPSLSMIAASFRLVLPVGLLIAGEVHGQCGPPITAFPYIEDFEAGPAWTSGGTNSDWAWGTPAHPTINSAGGGTRSWCVGGLTGSFYDYGELSYIESPCFDFTSLDHPWIQFKIFWQLERQYDGLVLQYSTDGGSTYANVGAYGDADDCLNAHWYNSNNVVNLTSASPRHGWSGGPAGSYQAGSSGGWVNAKHCMTTLAHMPSVRFRFLFGAGSQCNNYDGVALDDILIQDAPPNVPTLDYSCVGNTVDFSNVGDNCPTVFAWDFGDPDSGTANYSALENPSHTFSGPGAYTITFTQSSACTASGSVVLHLTILDVQLTVQDALCGPGTGSITAEVANAASPTFHWSPGGETTAAITGLDGGLYNVTVSAPGACPLTVEATVVENNNGMVVQGSHANTTCANTTDGSASVSITGGAPPYQYQWSPTGGDGPAATALAAGAYTCTVTDDAGCTTTHQETVGAPTPVVVSAPATANTCAGTSITLQATASGGTPGYTYAWTPEGPTVTPSGNTTYSVVATDAQGCISAAAQTDVQVGVAITPSFDTDDTTAGCAPLCVAFGAADPVDALTYTWSFGDGTSADGWAAAHCYPIAGVYDVVLTVSDAEGCAGSIIRPGLIRVWPQPVAAFGASATTVTTEHATVLFLDQSTAATQWYWQFGDAAGSSSAERSPAFTFPDVGCYPVSLTVANDDGCTAIAEQQICVEDPYAVYVPNTFTPNDDGINDRFGVVSSVRVPSEYRLTIFDRWGRELFNSTSAYQGWDGGSTPEGVYVWRLSIRDAEGKLHEHTGHVTLLR